MLLLLLHIRLQVENIVLEAVGLVKLALEKLARNHWLFISLLLALLVAVISNKILLEKLLLPLLLLFSVIFAFRFKEIIRQLEGNLLLVLAVPRVLL